MSWRKGWFSYLIWAVVAVVMCVFMANYLNVTSMIYGFDTFETTLFVWTAFALVFGVYLLLRFVYQRWCRRLEWLSRRTKIICEVFLMLSAFAGAVVTRVLYYVYQFDKTVGSMQFYEMAKIQEQGALPSVEHGASFLYTGVVSSLFSFFGNKPEAGIVMQMVLQVLAILFVYFAVRNLMGVREAIIVLAVLAFFPTVSNFSFTLTPENLYFFLFAGMLFLISVYKKEEEKQKRKLWIAGIQLAVIGLGCGYLCYLDAVGILLFATVLSFAWLGKKETGKKVALSSFLFGGSLFAFFGMLFCQAMFAGENFVTRIVSWWNLFFQNVGWHEVLVGADLAVTYSMAACVGVLWFLVSFFLGERDKGSLYMVSLLMLMFFASFTSPNMSYQLLITLYWAILAALGISSIMFHEQYEATEQFVVAQEQQTGVSEEAKTELDGEGMAKESVTEIIDLEQVADLEADARQEKKSVQFIENPLPLPKKHVKKTMDYKFEPDESLMRFDIEIEADDDFDLQ